MATTIIAMPSSLHQLVVLYLPYTIYLSWKQACIIEYDSYFLSSINALDV